MNQTPDHLQLLRERTRELHAELETVTGGERFLCGRFDPVHYTSFLLCHYLFHLEVARHIGAWPVLRDRGVERPTYQRIAGLRTDLRRLGLSQHRLESPTSLSLPLHSPGFAVGLCYVAEGSMIGSRRIHKGLSRSRAFVDAGADLFFALGADGLAERWNTFLQVLHEAAGQNYDDVERGAAAGFGLFRDLWGEIAEHPPDGMSNVD